MISRYLHYRNFQTRSFPINVTYGIKSDLTKYPTLSCQRSHEKTERISHPWENDHPLWSNITIELFTDTTAAYNIVLSGTFSDLIDVLNQDSFTATFPGGNGRSHNTTTNKREEGASRAVKSSPLHLQVTIKWRTFQNCGLKLSHAITRHTKNTSGM